MRQIKASEIKPGMTIRWETGGITHECVVEAVTPSLASGAVDVDAVGDGYMRIERATLITVLSEPKSVQPEEPTEFGAKVRVRDGRFVRLDDYAAGVVPWSEKGTGAWWSWDDLCEMGPVQVVPDQGWTALDDAPEVPERIEEWPEADEHLRKHKWRDMDGDTWTWAKAEDKWECRSRADIRMGASRRPGSWFSPFTRVTDA